MGGVGLRVVEVVFCVAEGAGFWVAEGRLDVLEVFSVVRPDEGLFAVAAVWPAVVASAFPTDAEDWAAYELSAALSDAAGGSAVSTREASVSEAASSEGAALDSALLPAVPEESETGLEDGASVDGEGPEQAASVRTAKRDVINSAPRRRRLFRMVPILSDPCVLRRIRRVRICGYHTMRFPRVQPVKSCQN